jgi:hypothetical protein
MNHPHHQQTPRAHSSVCVFDWLRYMRRFSYRTASMNVTETPVSDSEYEVITEYDGIPTSQDRIVAVCAHTPYYSHFVSNQLVHTVSTIYDFLKSTPPLPFHVDID